MTRGVKRLPLRTQEEIHGDVLALEETEALLQEIIRSAS